ncbi:hypothetical protein DFA_09270 [Cavenderia fasciculata]|uniref:F-box domain-containing protein n=1 Tax=Cavenderia fasciculata TaxID=261658 RepID=F4Q758_CACFS|nr:uncharacterized protein DFA_09270 [Cavenderia fasciculata]EGG16240.1 hypothetical protein DFA_09270 [Cavenderia fasciculata]|eukprot:XP_004354624.1 hypothetical protein DFA_09270 [Cavenderia fasciculata]
MDTNGRMNNNNSSRQKCYITERLSNLILLNIVEQLTDNLDIVCLLLTCKRFYFELRHNDNIKFKYIHYLTLTKGHGIVHPLTALDQTPLHTFKEIIARSKRNQLLIDHDHIYGLGCNHPPSSSSSSSPNTTTITIATTNKNNNNNNNIVDTINVNNNNNNNSKYVKYVLFEAGDCGGEGHLKRFVPPSTKRLYVENVSHGDASRLNAGDLPPQLEELSLQGCGSIEPGILPNSLNQLEITTGINVEHDSLPQSLRAFMLYKLHSQIFNFDFDGEFPPSSYQKTIRLSTLHLDNLSFLNTLDLSSVNLEFDDDLVFPPTLTTLLITTDQPLPDAGHTLPPSLTHLQLDFSGNEGEEEVTHDWTYPVLPVSFHTVYSRFKGAFGRIVFVSRFQHTQQH